MAFQSLLFKKPLTLLAIASMLSFGCGNPKPDNQGEHGEEPKDSAGPPILSINGQIFSIPSPVQTAMLINQSGAAFSKEMLNEPAKSSNYQSTYDRALNLGVYGADLGYLTIYNQNDQALAYFASVKKIGDELGIASSFDEKLMNRFKANIGKKDSIISLVSDAYRASDAYLKDSKRSEVGALILAGGWIESMHFATAILKTKPSQEVSNRIGEQKTSVTSLIKLLSSFNKPEYEGLVKQFKELASLFENIEMKYTFVEPTVQADKKLTILNSKTEVKITAEQVQAISDKIATIRKGIVQ
jgi:DNA-directed RNA polymerase subunit F